MIDYMPRMDAQGKVAVAVVSWNSGAWLARSLASLAVQSQPPHRIVIVDNASSDGSLSDLASLHESIEIVRLDCNAGFAAANNLAIERVSDCEWVALLNPDAFAEPDWLEQLLNAAAANPAFAFFASRMLSDANPELLDGAGDSYNFTGLPRRRGYAQTASGRYLIEDEVFSPCAGAALYRRDVVRDVGGFDESFFCYVEDVDLGFRLRLRGHRCLYVPAAAVRHVGSGTTGKDSDTAIYYGHRNLEWAFFKNMPWTLLLVFLLPHLLMNIAVIAWFVARGRGRVILAAKAAAIVGLVRVLRQRASIGPRGVSLRALVTMFSVWPYR